MCSRAPIRLRVYCRLQCTQASWCLLGSMWSLEKKKKNCTTHFSPPLHIAFLKRHAHSWAMCVSRAAELTQTLCVCAYLMILFGHYLMGWLHVCKRGQQQCHPNQFKAPVQEGCFFYFFYFLCQFCFAHSRGRSCRQTSTKSEWRSVFVTEGESVNLKHFF